MAGLIDSPVLWHSALQSLDNSKQSFAKLVHDHVPATLDELKTASLSRSGVVVELSNRLRLYVIESNQRLFAIKKRADDRLAVLNSLLRDYESPDVMRGIEIGPVQPVPVPAPIDVNKNDDDDDEANDGAMQEALRRQSAALAAQLKRAEDARAAKADVHSIVMYGDWDNERNLWLRRLASIHAFGGVLVEVVSLPDVSQSDRSISREGNDLVRLRIERALQSVRGGWQSKPGGTAVIGGDEARRFLASALAPLENAHVMSEAIELFYAQGRAALDKIHALNAQLRPEEAALLTEQAEENRQLESDVILRLINESLTLAAWAAQQQPPSAELERLISNSRRSLLDVKQSLDATQFVEFGARLLASLRGTAQTVALSESRLNQHLSSQVAALTHLTIAGFLMEAELALARWQRKSEAELRELDAPLRAAEALLARRTLLLIRAYIERKEFVPASQQDIFDDYRALVQQKLDPEKIDFVPIPSSEILASFASGGASKATQEIVANLQRYDRLQREYFGEVVVREPLSLRYDQLAFIGKQQLSFEAQNNVKLRVQTSEQTLVDADAALEASAASAGESWYSSDPLGKQLEADHSALKLRLANLTQTVDKYTMQLDQPDQAKTEFLRQSSATILGDLRVIVSIVNSLFSKANSFLNRTVTRRPLIDDLFRAFRLIQEMAAALLREYFQVDVQLPTSGTRELLWKPIDLTTQLDDLQQTLNNLGLG
jgi:hypothetical protein